MATDDQQVLVTGTASAPTHFTIPGNGQIQPKAVFAHFDGASAATAFVPALKVISDGGETVAICPCPTTVAAAGSADVSWFPHVAFTEESEAAPGVTVEQLFFDQQGPDGGMWAVYSSTVLAAGQNYVITVQGTYSEWNAVLAFGSPEANAMFPGSTAGRVSLEVGLDAECCFASESNAPDPFGIEVGNHLNIFQMDLGSGFVHVEPEGGPYSSPQPNHFYRYSVTGQGSVVGFGNIATPRSDNYGKLLITIQNPSASSGSLVPGGGADHAILRSEGGVPTWESRPDIVEADLSLSNVTTADVSTTKHGFAPKAPNDATKFLDGTGAYSVPASSGGITDLTSTGSTITVSSPTGPTTNVDLPTTGVSAGTYGDAGHVSRITVDAEGRLTAASSVSISGTPGSGLVLLFDSTLGADAASIDTGAGGISTSYTTLFVFAVARTAFAAVQAAVHFVINNDTGSNYTRQFLLGNQGIASAGANANVGPGTGTDVNVVGDNAAANVATSLTIHIPNYSGTTFYKSGLINVASAAPSNAVTSQTAFLWANTAAISRLAMVGDSANLRAGSRLTIYGT